MQKAESRAAGPARPVRVVLGEEPVSLVQGDIPDRVTAASPVAGPLEELTMRQILTLSLVALVAAFALSACSSLDQGAMKRAMYVDQHPELPATMADAIRDGQITVGMTQEMVQVAWGKPVRTEQLSKGDAASQWSYGNVFLGGNITSLYFDMAGLLVRYEVNYQPTSANGGNVQIENPNPAGYTSGSDGTITKNGGQP
jgi:hypothetical protein